MTLCLLNAVRTEAITQFGLALQQRDNHPMQPLIKGGILHWLTANSSPFDPVLAEYPKKFQEATQRSLSDQSFLGLDKATKGYLSLEW